MIPIRRISCCCGSFMIYFLGYDRLPACHYFTHSGARQAEAYHTTGVRPAVVVNAQKAYSLSLLYALNGQDRLEAYRTSGVRPVAEVK